MGVLRCTAKYRKAFSLPEKLGEPNPPLSALGCWYANTLNVGHGRYLHYMSEKARLSVIVPLRHRETAEQRFTQTLADLLTHFGAASRYVDKEVSTLMSLADGRTTSRSVLGSMRDHAYLTKGYLQDDLSLWDVMLFLAESPAGPLDWDSANRVAPRLLDEWWGGPRPVS